MNLSKIVAGLAMIPANEDAEPYARLGFLEWAMGLTPDQNPHHAAFAASARMHSFVSVSPAVAHFRTLLADAALPLPMPQKRKGGSARNRIRYH